MVGSINKATLLVVILTTLLINAEVSSSEKSLSSPESHWFDRISQLFKQLQPLHSPLLTNSTQADFLAPESQPELTIIDDSDRISPLKPRKPSKRKSKTNKSSGKKKHGKKRKRVSLAKVLSHFQRKLFALYRKIEFLEQERRDVEMKKTRKDENLSGQDLSDTSTMKEGKSGGKVGTLDHVSLQKALELVQDEILSILVEMQTTKRRFASKYKNNRRPATKRYSRTKSSSSKTALKESSSTQTPASSTPQVAHAQPSTETRTPLNISDESHPQSPSSSQPTLKHASSMIAQEPTPMRADKKKESSLTSRRWLDVPAKSRGDILKLSAIGFSSGLAVALLVTVYFNLRERRQIALEKSNGSYAKA
jgi:hypothetical protein